MSLSGRKIKVRPKTLLIAASEFNQKLPTLRVNSSGAIGANMELGLSADANTATLEGGTGVTGVRTLLTNPTNVYAGLDDTTVLLEKTSASVGLLGWSMGATNDVVRSLRAVPEDWDHLKPTRARVHGILQSVTPSQLGVFRVHIGFQQSNVAWDIQDLEYNCTLYPVTNAYYPTVSAWQTPTTAWGPTYKAKTNPILMLVSLVRSATVTLSGTIHISAVEIEYYPRL